jgi:glycosyltransferase involved in cell wall biosynthesis
MGGQEKLLLEFARHADRRRFGLHFVSLSTRGILAEDLEACGWPVVALEEPPGLRPGLVLRLAGLFRRWKTEVVHTHDDRPLIYGVLAARLARVRRVIHTRHGQSFWITLRQTALVKMVARLTDRFVCVSEDSARLTIQHGVAAQRVGSIWNGIDVSRFPYAGPDPKGPVVTVARLSPEKDIDTLLRAASLLAPQDPAFRLAIAGDGVCLPALKRTAADLGLGERAHFLGQVRDIPALLATASLFVLPSLSEGVSLTLLEAMACGLPVVATRVGGNPEVVAEAETGLLVPARDPTALAEAILRLRRDPDGCRRLGLAGRRRVESLFDIRHMVARYEALYQQTEVRGRKTAQTSDL